MWWIEHVGCIVSSSNFQQHFGPQCFLHRQVGAASSTSADNYPIPAVDNSVGNNVCTVHLHLRTNSFGDSAEHGNVRLVVSATTIAADYHYQSR